MRFDFDGLLDRCQQGQPARLGFEAEGCSYTRLFRPPERLILLGAGHISQALCRLACELGFSVTVADERAEFASRDRFPGAHTILCDGFLPAIEAAQIRSGDYVTILTRGHRYDADCLRAVLSGQMPRYLGMIGSKKRVAEQLRMLEAEGFPRQALERVHTPIGLEIGALTAPEIAVSIAAQLIQCRRKDVRCRPGSSVLTTEDIDLPLLGSLAERTPKALLIVYESSGSTPAKSGAMMAVDRAGGWAGTIGGGAAEHEAMEAARRLIGTGGSQCLTVDMDNDAAAEEGMACGGRMKVWIADVEERG